MAKPMTKADKIRNYIANRPDATASQVAKATGAKPPQVYAIMANAKKKTGAEAEVKLPAPKLIEAPTQAGTDIGDMLKERGDRYGTFVGNSTVSQMIKQTIFMYMSQEKYNDMHFDQIEALEMIAHKIARIVNGDPNYADNWKDIAGYAKLVSDRLETGATT
jgi:hypothetical protein